MDTIVRDFCNGCGKLKTLRLRGLDISNGHQIHLLEYLPMLRSFHFQSPYNFSTLSSDDLYKVFDLVADTLIRHLLITACMGQEPDSFFFSHISSNSNLETLQIRNVNDRLRVTCQTLDICAILDRFPNLTTLGLHNMDAIAPLSILGLEGHHPIHTLQFIVTNLHCSAFENLSQCCPYIRHISIRNNCTNQLIELPKHHLHNVEICHNYRDRHMPKNIVVAIFTAATSEEFSEDSTLLTAGIRFYELGGYTHTQKQCGRDMFTKHRYHMSHVYVLV